MAGAGGGGGGRFGGSARGGGGGGGPPGWPGPRCAVAGGGGAGRIPGGGVGRIPGRGAPLGGGGGATGGGGGGAQSWNTSRGPRSGSPRVIALPSWMNPVDIRPPSTYMPPSPRSTAIHCLPL